MHDPMTVVFTIRRPWPYRTKGPSVHRPKRWKLTGTFWTLAGRTFYWPAWVTVWHVEPKGHDGGSICKGMGGSELTLHNVMWAIRHWRHLQINVEPYLRVRRWLLDRCEGCGHRFRWKRDARHSYMGTDKVWHDPCMSLRHVRSQLDDLTKYLQATADETTRWRVEYRLKGIEEKAAKDQEPAR